MMKSLKFEILKKVLLENVFFFVFENRVFFEIINVQKRNNFLPYWYIVIEFGHRTRHTQLVAQCSP